MWWFSVSEKIDIDDISDLIGKTKGATRQEKAPLAYQVVNFLKDYDKEYREATAQVLKELGVAQKDADMVARKMSFVNIELIKLYRKYHKENGFRELHSAIIALLKKMQK